VRTRIKAEDRAGLERLCRYVTRPPLAAGRLQLIDADHLTFRLKTPWSDGTTHLLLSPLELIEKLAALIPPRRLNLVRYHGILAPNAHERSQTVPAPPSPTVSLAPGDSPAAPLRPHRLPWAAFIGARLCARRHRLPRLWWTPAPDRRTDRPRIGPGLSTRGRPADRAAAASPR